MKRYCAALLTYSLLFSLTIMLIGCEIPELKSRWRDREIVVDGKESEWGNYIQYYHEKSKTIICMFNDETYLYIKVSTPNRMMQQQLTVQGFTIWFDPECSQKKTFGIHFPIGLQNYKKNTIRLDTRNRSRKEQAELKKIIEESQSKVEILGPGLDEAFIMSTADAEKNGISVRIGRQAEIMVYELKVPLDKSGQHYYAIGTRIAGKIGIGFETGEKTGKPDSEDRRSETVDPNKGYNGQRGSRGGSGGLTGMKPRGPMIPESLDYWVNVTLADTP